MSRRPLKERLLSRVSPEPNTGCWLWVGGCVGGGYGAIRVAGQGSPMTVAHRASWTAHRGPVPEGLCVCHRCDTPACVNPDHLFLGTNQENVDDKVRKGRAKGARKGERNHAARLTPEKVLEIRRRHSLGESTRRLAKAFGVGQRTAHHVVSRGTWRHLP